MRPWLVRLLLIAWHLWVYQGKPGDESSPRFWRVIQSFEEHAACQTFAASVAENMRLPSGRITRRVICQPEGVEPWEKPQ
jgi:hypothetical protein